MKPITIDQFTHEEATDHREQAAIELWSLAHGYDHLPTISYDRRIQDGKDVLVLRVDGLPAPFMVGAEILLPDEYVDDRWRLTQARRRVVHQALLEAICDAGDCIERQGIKPDTSAKRWAPGAPILGIEEVIDDTDRLACTLRVLVGGAEPESVRFCWQISPDTTTLTVGRDGGQSWSSSMSTPKDIAIGVKDRRPLMLNILRLRVQSEAARINKRTQEHRARQAAAAPAA